MVVEKLLKPAIGLTLGVLLLTGCGIAPTRPALEAAHIPPTAMLVPAATVLPTATSIATPRPSATPAATELPVGDTRVW